MIRAGNPDTMVSLVEVETAGDRDPVGPIAELTELGAFVRAVQAAVRDDRADLEVHSLKDLPGRARRPRPGSLSRSGLALWM